MMPVNKLTRKVQDISMLHLWVHTDTRSCVLYLSLRPHRIWAELDFQRKKHCRCLITELETYTQSIPKTWKNVFLSLMRGDVTVGQFLLRFSTLLPERNRPELFSGYPKISPNPSASLSVIFGCSVLRQLSAESKRVGFLWSLLSAGFY